MVLDSFSLLIVRLITYGTSQLVFDICSVIPYLNHFSWRLSPFLPCDFRI